MVGVFASGSYSRPVWRAVRKRFGADLAALEWVHEMCPPGLSQGQDVEGAELDLLVALAECKAGDVRG